jgi:transcriptional regulator with XRE-family HTH domain
VETVGQRLRRARLRRGWSQADLKEQAGVSIVTLSRIENDQLEELPRPSTVRKLATALGVTPGWLFYGEEAADLEAKFAA